MEILPVRRQVSPLSLINHSPTAPKCVCFTERAFSDALQPTQTQQLIYTVVVVVYEPVLANCDQEGGFTNKTRTWSDRISNKTHCTFITIF